MRISAVSRRGLGLVCLFFGAFMTDAHSFARGQSYTATLVAFEGSIGCRAGLKGPAAGPELSIDVELKDPTGKVLKTASDSTYSTNVRVEFAVPPTVSGTYTCYGRFDVNGTTIEYLIDQHQIVLPPPVPTSLSVYYDQYLWRSFNNYNRELRYQVLEQQGRPLHVGGLQVVETYVKLRDTCPMPAIQTATTSTNAQGQFKDNYRLSSVPGCQANPACSATFEQTIRVANRVVRVNEVTYGCNGVTITPR